MEWRLQQEGWGEVAHSAVIIPILKGKQPPTQVVALAEVLEEVDDVGAVDTRDGMKCA